MKSRDDVKKYKLTAFLIKDTYQEITDFVSADGLSSVEISRQGEVLGTLIYKGGFKSKPSWVGLFEGTPNFDSAALFNQSSKAIFLTKYEGRWFCFTFGYARHLIDDLAYERNFGLIVTLNLGDPKAIKSIDKSNISHISLHSKEQATKEIELSNFEFNNDIDLLKSVTANAPLADGDDYETLSGRDSVTIYTRVTVESFGEIAKKLYEAYTDKKYLQLYPWIEKIREERDTAVIEKLEQLLLQRILKREFTHIWMAIPEVVAWEEIDGFSYKQVSTGEGKSGPVLYRDLDLATWLQSVRNPASVTVRQLHNKKVYIYWLDGRQPSSWSVYRCINAEIDLDGKKYILNDGDWFNIEQGYVAEVNTFYQSVNDTKITLPTYGVMTEPEYLEFVAQKFTQYALMDRKEIMIGGGRSRVEFCDLYSQDKQIIHVKKYGGSSLLSHLFSQALVSGDCFLHDPDFRAKLNRMLPLGFQLADPITQPDQKEYEICIAVMSDVPGPMELPFFSKVSFKYAVRSLQKLGFKVSKLKIDR